MSKKIQVQCRVLQVEYNTFCAAGIRGSPFTPILSNRAMYMKWVTKKPLTWCRSLYITMKLANIAMLGCMFVTYTDICKHIMFTVHYPIPNNDLLSFNSCNIT